jgi:hypothetical protein
VIIVLLTRKHLGLRNGGSIERILGEMVKKAWSIICPNLNPMDRWQAKIRNFHRLVRGWATNVIAELNKHKQVVTAEYNLLDLESENRSLDAGGQVRMKDLGRELDKLWALEKQDKGLRIG